MQKGRTTARCIEFCRKDPVQPGVQSSSERTHYSQVYAGPYNITLQTGAYIYLERTQYIQVSKYKQIDQLEPALQRDLQKGHTTARCIQVLRMTHYSQVLTYLQKGHSTSRYLHINRLTNQSQLYRDICRKDTLQTALQRYLQKGHTKARCSI